MSTIRMENITKQFSPREPYCNVYDLNIEVGDGELFCLVGPTNSGKTTTLRLLAGLSSPDKGNVYIDGILVNDVPPSRREVAMLFETLALYPNKSGYDNIASPLKVQKRPKEEIHKKTMDVAKLLNLEHLLNRLPATFSGGEKQRVALGRILVQQPNAYLLDEPLGGLDARLRITMRSKLKAIQKNLGQTMIIVTHDQEEAMSLGNRIAVLKEGNIQQIGTPQQLYDRPRNLYVAKTIGMPAMNFYDCELHFKDGRVLVIHDQFSVDITERWQKTGIDFEGGGVILGIRPEHIEIAEEPIEDLFSAQVFISEPLGAKTIVDFKVGPKTVRTLVPSDGEFEINDTKYLLIRKNKLHLFAQDTQESLFA